jgi:hypothetical protein
MPPDRGYVQLRPSIQLNQNIRHISSERPLRTHSDSV